jgi:hypothetical protein
VCPSIEKIMSWFSGSAAKSAQGLGSQMTPERQIQAMKMGAQAVPGGQKFQFFPTQVGGPTPYARSRRPVFVGVCIFQALMAVMALIEFANFLSGIIMILGLMVALWAFKEQMNITYVCWWGCLCVAGFIAGIVGAVIGFAFTITTIIAKFNIPLSCFFGMVLAWNYYVDYEENHDCTDTVGSWLRALGLLKKREPPPPPQSQQQIMPGMPAGLASPSWLPSFGGMNETSKFGSGQFDSMKAQAGAYGQQAQGQAAGYGQQAQAQAGLFGGMAGAFGAQAQGQAGQYGAMGQDQMAGWQAQGNGAQGQAGSFVGGLFGQAQGAQEQAGGLFQTHKAAASNMGTGLFGQAEEKAAQMQANMPTVPQGRVDTRRDPFMTL